MHNPRPLAGYRILIIEDEMMPARRITHMLAELGGTAGKIAFNNEQGWEALGTRWDCGIVDLNLKCKLAYPWVAALIQQRIPFITCSAFGDALDADPEIATATRVNQPVTLERLRDAVLRGGSVCLNNSRVVVKWISALVMPPPGLASAG